MLCGMCFEMARKAVNKMKYGWLILFAAILLAFIAGTTEIIWFTSEPDLQQAAVVPYIPLPAAKDPNTGIELSAQQNPFQFRCWILPVGTKIIYPDGTEKILFEKAFLTMGKVKQ